MVIAFEPTQPSMVACRADIVGMAQNTDWMHGYNVPVQQGHVQPSVIQFDRHHYTKSPLNQKNSISHFKYILSICHECTHVMQCHQFDMCHPDLLHPCTCNIIMDQINPIHPCAYACHIATLASCPPPPPPPHTCLLHLLAPLPFHICSLFLLSHVCTVLGKNLQHVTMCSSGILNCFVGNRWGTTSPPPSLPLYID